MKKTTPHAAATEHSQSAPVIAEQKPQATSTETAVAPAVSAAVAGDIEHIEAVDAVDPHHAQPSAELIHAGLVDVSTAEEEADEVDTIAVVAKREGFRRAGRSFGAQPTYIDTDDLTAAQLLDLIHEPMLVVSFVSHMKGA